MDCRLLRVSSNPATWARFNRRLGPDINTLLALASLLRTLAVAFGVDFRSERTTAIMVSGLSFWLRFLFCNIDGGKVEIALGI